MKMNVQIRHVYQLALSAIHFVPLFVASYYAAFLLRFAGELDSRADKVFFATLFWLVAVKWTAFVWFRLHQGWTRFIGFDDLLALAKAVSCAAIGIMIVDAMWLTNL